MPGVNGIAAAGPDWNALRANSDLRRFVVMAIDSDNTKKISTITTSVTFDGHAYEISYTPKAALSPLARAFRTIASDLFGIVPRSHTRRTDLPKSIGGRIVDAIGDLFRHRIRDAWDPQSPVVPTLFPSRARLIDAVFEELYQRRARVLTPTSYQPDSGNDYCKT